MSKRFTGQNLNLNQRAHAIVNNELLALQDAPLSHALSRHDVAGATILDCGTRATMASMRIASILARVCMSNEAEVSIHSSKLAGVECPRVQVVLDEPLVGCLFSQYAGWPISVGNYFAMGSGPMRATLASEAIFAEYQYREETDLAVGVLETNQLPTADVVNSLCDQLKVSPSKLCLLVARTASLAGSFQVVARSVETCLHKLHELKFDVSTIRTGIGSAWLPPIPRKDIVAIGRTNDSILYGGEVTLWVDSDDDLLRDIGPKIPSNSSADFGQPFEQIFERYHQDFYKVDKTLFSPAVVVLHNLSSGNSFRFGERRDDIVQQSFGWSN